MTNGKSVAVPLFTWNCAHLATLFVADVGAAGPIVVALLSVIALAVLTIAPLLISNVSAAVRAMVSVAEEPPVIFNPAAAVISGVTDTPDPANVATAELPSVTTDPFLILKGDAVMIYSFHISGS
jgi:hypothetical protein